MRSVAGSRCVCERLALTWIICRRCSGIRRRSCRGCTRRPERRRQRSRRTGGWWGRGIEKFGGPRGPLTPLSVDFLRRQDRRENGRDEADLRGLRSSGGTVAVRGVPGQAGAGQAAAARRELAGRARGDPCAGRPPLPAMRGLLPASASPRGEPHRAVGGGARPALRPGEPGDALPGVPRPGRPRAARVATCPKRQTDHTGRECLSGLESRKANLTSYARPGRSVGSQGFLYVGNISDRLRDRSGDVGASP